MARKLRVEYPGAGYHVMNSESFREQAAGTGGNGDAGKLAIVQQLRCETTVTLAWIAERLQMGTKTLLAHLLYWRGREKQK